MAIIVAIAVIVIALYGAYWMGGRKADTKAIQEAVDRERKVIDGKWQAVIEGKEEEIRERNRAIADLQKRYSRLIAEIKRKAAEARSIRPPASDGETRERFKALGYPPNE